ncbi:MAG: amidase [Anaerolineae bacterium]
MSELTRLTIEHLAPRLATGEVSPIEVTQAYLDRIAAHEPTLNAYIRVTPESALAEAQAADNDIRRGAYRGPLHGIPIALKDLFDVAGVPTTAGSAFFLDNVPTQDAPSVARLKAAGAVILGKLNMHEIALGVFGDSSYFGPTRNPWDPTRMPGGSSGGSGAAVAARLCAAATGSDTGGSIRIPSALCGVVGLKPTYGRVSNRGVLPLSYSLDHVGPMARGVYDVAVMLQAMSGYDPDDPASADQPVPSFTADLDRGVRGLTIALDPQYSLVGATGDVLNGLHETLEALKRLGAEIVEVSLPRLVEANEAALNILRPEASALHEERLRTQLEKFQPDVQARLPQGFEVSGMTVARALRVRAELMVDFRRLFQTADAFIAPTCAVPAPPIGTTEVEVNGQTVGAREAIARYTRPFNLAGLPALSIPSGFTSDGLPVGVQLVGAWWNEATLLRIARALEGTRPWPTPDE